jgi:hypothetical protein
MSQMSLNSTESQSEDWDRSMSVDEDHDMLVDVPTKTPRNSVIFPADGSQDTPRSKAGGKRTLSELLRLHAGQGADALSTEEASRVADVLGQWVSRSSSSSERD